MKKWGTRTFENISENRLDTILNALAEHGSLVKGNNPWDVETKNHGVRLRGEWNRELSRLTITVMDANWYVTRNTVWENIESLMKIVQDAA